MLLAVEPVGSLTSPGLVGEVYNQPRGSASIRTCVRFYVSKLTSMYASSTELATYPVPEKATWNFSPS